MAKITSVNKVVSRFDTATQAQRTLFKRFRRFDDIFNTTFSTSYSTPSGSKVFVPTAWSAIETLVPRMLNRNPSINYIPIGSDDLVKAKKSSQLFSYWYNKSDAFEPLVQMVKAALIYGTSFGKLTWKFETTKKKMRNEEGKVVEDVVVSYDDPYLEYVNIYDIFVDPQATSLDDARWVIHRIYTSLSDLEKQQADMERNIKQLEEAGMEDVAETIVPFQNLKALKSKVSGSVDRSQEEIDKRQTLGIDTTAKDDTVDEVVLLEMWDKQTKTVTLVAKDYNILLREQPFPYWHDDFPFIMMVDSVVPGEFWGRGEIEPIEKIQAVINTVTNQRVDNVNMILNLMWKARPTVDDEELVPMQGQIIHVEDLSDVEPIQFPNVTTRAFEELGFWRQQVQEILGITDYIRGMRTPSDETLGEVQIKTAQANFRFQHKIQLFEKITLKRLGYLVLSLYQQYLTEEKEIRIFGEEGVIYTKVSPADILGEYDVVPEAGSTAPDPNDVTKEELVNFYMLVKDDPLWNKREVAKRVAEKFGFRNVENVINEVEEQPIATPQEGQEGEVKPEEGGGATSTGFDLLNIPTTAQLGGVPPLIRPEELTGEV